MNWQLLAYVGVFAAATIGLLVSLPRVQRITDPDTRFGMATLVLTSAAWAGSQLGYLLLPGPNLKIGAYLVGLVFGLAAVLAWLYFCAAYTGRSPRDFEHWPAVIAIFLAIVALKVTNPFHQLYFTTAVQTAPFPHLAIHHQLIHWVVLGLSYSVSTVGYFMLLEQFGHTGSDTKPLAVLVGLTALPVAFTVAGGASPWLIDMTYEPIGVAVFVIGVLFVYDRRFEAVQLAGESDEPVIFLDSGDRIRDYNRSAVRMFPALRGSIGTAIESVVPPVAERIDAAGEDVFEREVDGERRYFRVSTTPFTAGETRTGSVLMLSDVTETERYQRRLEERTEQLEVLNRVVRHDIRNDMSVVLSWSELLREHVDEEGRDALERVRGKAQHVVELTANARDFVDALVEEESLDLTSVDLAPILRDELETQRQSFPSATFEVSDSLPDVAVEANEMLSSVFRNLLQNAVHHNDQEHPEVRLSVTETADTVTIRVADNGPGVPDEAKETVFGKGEKGLDSEGTGIGLYLVDELVDQFGGRVSIEDNEPRGAVFVVELRKV